MQIWKKKLTDASLIKKCLKSCSFHVKMNFINEIILDGEYSMIYSTKTAWTIDFKSCIHRFPQFFQQWIIWFLWQYFGKFWNQVLNKNSQKQIIQKMFEKKKNMCTVLFGSWQYAFQWQKTTENHKSVGDLHFPNIQTAWKRYKTDV